jgi:hypothetical protein
MVIKVDSWLYKLLYALPIWLPYSIEYTRVGSRYTDYVLVIWRKPK